MQNVTKQNVVVFQKWQIIGKVEATAAEEPGETQAASSQGAGLR